MNLWTLRFRDTRLFVQGTAYLLKRKSTETDEDVLSEDIPHKVSVDFCCSYFRNCLSISGLK